MKKIITCLVVTLFLVNFSYADLCDGCPPDPCEQMDAPFDHYRYNTQCLIPLSSCNLCFQDDDGDNVYNCMDNDWGYYIIFRPDGSCVAINRDPGATDGDSDFDGIPNWLDTGVFPDTPIYTHPDSTVIDTTPIVLSDYFNDDFPPITIDPNDPLGPFDNGGGLLDPDFDDNPFIDPPFIIDPPIRLNLGGGKRNLDDQNNISIKAYPNPNNGRFKLLLNGTEYTQIQIIDQNGNVVYSNDKVPPGLYRAKFDHLSSGLYFIYATTTKGSDLTKIVIH